MFHLVLFLWFFFRFLTFVRVWVSGPAFFSFCGFTVCIREFLQVYVCQSLGVRALLRILLLGVSEVSRFNMSQDFFEFGLSV